MTVMEETGVSRFPRLPRNVTYRKFWYWVRKGWIDLDATPGRGHERDIDDYTYRVLFAMGKLRDAGFEGELASVIAKQVAHQVSGVPLLVTAETGVEGLAVEVEWDDFFADLLD